LDRHKVLEIARKLQRRYTAHRRQINPKQNYTHSLEAVVGPWVTLAYRLFCHSVDPDIYITWAVTQIFPRPVFPTTVSSSNLFDRFLSGGVDQTHKSLDFEITYSANCLLSRVGGDMSMLSVLREEVNKVGYMATDNTSSGHVAAAPDHLDVVVLYIACKQETGATDLVARLLPFAKSAMSRSPYVQSRIASLLPQELLNDHAFTLPSPDASAQAVHGAVPVPKPTGS